MTDVKSETHTENPYFERTRLIERHQMEVQETAVGAVAETGAINDAPDGQTEGTQGQAAVTPEKFAVLEERYKNSSQEGVRLHGENKELKARLEKLEKASSLTSQQNQNQQQQGVFPSREQYVKYWVENGEKTEKEAGAEYEREKFQHERELLRDQALSALTKRVQYESEERDRSISNLSPRAKEAQDFWSDNPAMSSLPVSEQIEQMDKVRTKLGAPPKVQRDLSEVKGALGSTVGGAVKPMTGGTSEQDAIAKKHGFPSYAAQMEMNKCTSQADFKAWDLKWKKKK